MDHIRNRTTKFYNNHARQLRDRYRDMGPRDGDVMLGLALAGSLEHPRVLEIGCGYGREASIILERTPYYTGIDASEKFIEIAREQIPHGTFECADAVAYDYPGTYDIVFALVVMRHLDQQEIKTMLQKVHDSLAPNGICYIALTYGEKFQAYMRKDAMGARVEYLYNPTMIMQLAGKNYSKLYEARYATGDVEWFDLVLKKLPTTVETTIND